MMKQAQQMQERLQQQMAELRVEGNAGGGMVTVVVNGAKQVQSLKIDPEVVSKEDVEMLQDLIVAAINDAHRKADEEMSQKMGGMLPPGIEAAQGCNCVRSHRSRSIRLIEELQRLPGIGPKGAQRLAFHILKTPREQTERLADALREVKERVTYCSVCNNITDVDPCAYCSSDGRDPRIICVVEEPQNVSAIEKTREFKGMYHVLMGALSPLQGIGPDDLKIKGLLGARERGRQRSHPRDQPQRRRRGDRDLSRAAAEAARRQGDADRDGRAGRQRPRVRRRSDDAQVDGRTARGLTPVTP